MKSSEIGWRKDLMEEDSEGTSNRQRCRSPKPDKKKKKHHRPHRSSSSSSSTSSSSSSSSDKGGGGKSDRAKRKCERLERRKAKKEAKRQRREEKKCEKLQKREHKKAKKEAYKRMDSEQKNKDKQPEKSGGKADEEQLIDFGVPIDLMNNKACAPQTREEYEARQSHIRRVVDPETGRERLIKGDGEILEEIVSRSRHVEINKQATASDGAFFQSRTYGWTSNNL